jgi:D-lactate dehydrogenase
MKIAFFDTKPYDRQSFDQYIDQYDIEIKYFEAKLNEDTVALAAHSDVVCAFVNDTLNEAVLDTLVDMGIDLLALRCAGYNHVDFEAAYDKVHIVRVPAYSPYAVAEHAIALMFSLNRKTHRAYVRTRDNNFNINGLTGFDFHGKTVGVIGTGKIGRIFIDICKGLGMKILAYDMYPSEIEGVEFVDLTSLYQKSDIISLHCPLTQDTHYMIDDDAIQQMKEGVMLINTSRGALVQTEHLIDGLKSKKIGSAGLDVYEEESEYFFEDFSSESIDDDNLARLLSFSNVLVTSHQAFLTKEALSNIAETTLENVKAYQEGSPLVNEVCYHCPDVPANCNKKETGRCF